MKRTLQKIKHAIETETLNSNDTIKWIDEALAKEALRVAKLEQSTPYSTVFKKEGGMQ